MKRRLIMVILALILVLSTVSTAFASVGLATLGAKRTSNTKAKVNAFVIFNQVATTSSAKIDLQEKYNGSWRTAKGVPVTTVKKTATKNQYIDLYYTFTLVKGKLYRQKATFVDKRNGVTCTSTYYGSSF